MPVEVKQLTINSVFQREEVDAGENDSDETVTEKKKTSPAENNAACIDTEQVKADVLAACKKQIRQSLYDRLVR